MATASSWALSSSGGVSLARFSSPSEACPTVAENPLPYWQVRSAGVASTSAAGNVSQKGRHYSCRNAGPAALQRRTHRSKAFRMSATSQERDGSKCTLEDLDPGGLEDLVVSSPVAGIASMTELLGDDQAVEDVESAVGTLTATKVSTGLSQGQLASGSPTWLDGMFEPPEQDEDLALEQEVREAQPGLDHTLAGVLDGVLPGGWKGVEDVVPDGLLEQLKKPLRKAAPAVKLAAKVASGAVKGAAASTMASTVGASGGFVPGHLEMAALQGAVMGASVDLAGAIVDPAGERAGAEFLERQREASAKQCPVKGFIGLASEALMHPVDELVDDACKQEFGKVPSERQKEEKEQLTGEGEHFKEEKKQKLEALQRVDASAEKEISDDEPVEGRDPHHKKGKDTVTLVEVGGKAIAGALKGAAAGAVTEAASHGVVPLGAARGAVGGLIGETLGSVDPAAEADDEEEEEEGDEVETEDGGEGEQNAVRASDDAKVNSEVVLDESWQGEALVGILHQEGVFEGVDAERDRSGSDDGEGLDEEDGCGKEERRDNDVRVVKLVGKAVTGALKGAAAGTASEIAATGTLTGIGAAKAAIGTAVAEVMTEAAEKTDGPEKKKHKASKDSSNGGTKASRERDDEQHAEEG